MKAIDQGIEPVALLNMMNENGKVSRSHAIPKAVLERQAAAIKYLPLYTVPATWPEYEGKYISALKKIKKEHNMACAVFGDIDLQPHREWEEKVCRTVGIEAILPLWQRDRKELVNDMIDEGVETIIVSCNTKMGGDFLGRTISKELVDELINMNVDACGENGEFHTLVVNCPLFVKRINVALGEKRIHKDYCFIEMKYADNG